MKTAKKLFAALLAVVMVMALVTVPALAAGDDDTTAPTYSIKITAPDNSNEHQFQAYQIFSGTLSSEDTLTDVVWGSGIDSAKLDALYTALKAIDIGTADNSEKPFEKINPDSAASVSDVLTAYQTDPDKDAAALAVAFQELITAKTGSDYTYLSTQKTDITHDEQAAAGSYEAAGVSAGYYVVVDEANTNAADMMLRVVGNVTVTAKMNVPSATKYAGDVAIDDNATFSVGDEISYTLTGTTPNFKQDKSYSYTFTDTMDDALDLVYTPSKSNDTQVEGGVTVTIGTGDDATDITDKFEITYANHVLKLVANELKDSGIDATSRIYVTYKAKVNSKVLEGKDVNNKVVVESKADEEETTTPEIKEQVYPITLEVTKIDGADNTKVLSGAKFVLYRYVGESEAKTKQYATTDLKTGKFTGWTDDETQAATLTSGADGKITLIGVGAGTFYLQETEAPTGYNKLNTIIKIDIVTKSEVDGTGTVQLKSLSYSLTDMKAENDAEQATGGENNGTAVNVLGQNLNDGKVAFNVTNNQGAQLPSTGGIGTTIFYVLGGILIVGAVVLLVTRKRMREE